MKMQCWRDGEVFEATPYRTITNDIGARCPRCNLMNFADQGVARMQQPEFMREMRKARALDRYLLLTVRTTHDDLAG